MLTKDQVIKIALELIGTIAPEADISHLNPNEPLRNQFDFDSVDFLNFANAMEDRLNLKIPEEDYPQLATLDGCAAYIKSKITP